MVLLPDVEMVLLFMMVLMSGGPKRKHMPIEGSKTKLRELELWENGRVAVSVPVKTRRGFFSGHGCRVYAVWGIVGGIIDGCRYFYGLHLLGRVGFQQGYEHFLVRFPGF